MTIELGVISAHLPRICFEEEAPGFYKPLIDGMKAVQKEIEKIKPDAVVLISAHWQSTFDNFVDATPRHKGILTATEAPNLISNVPYSYPGEEELASQLVKSGQQANIPVVKINDPTYIWDYGAVVPLRYLIPNEDVPVIELSCCWSASLEETYQWGRQIAKVLRESEKRVVFVSSGALSHNLVRGPEKHPTLSEQALNNQFIEHLNNNDYASAWEMLPQYARNAGVEAGGRHVAALLGALEGSYKSQFFGYGQSSGSGNVVMTFSPQ
jgi:3,4-dihydroxyphenylacetate 2,3-dioxygenase